MPRIYRYLFFYILPALLIAVSLLAASASALADFQALEAGLNPAGDAYEINVDAGGLLWISDYSAGEVWRVDPAAGSYKVYPVGGSPSDARRAGNYIFWVDGNQISRLEVNTNQYQTWTVNDASELFSTAVDGNGRLWSVDFVTAYLYRLDPDPVDPLTDKNLCKYTLPDSGMMSNYLLWFSQEGEEYLWFSDDLNHRLLRYNITDDRLEWWQDAAWIGSVQGLALDSQSRLWYADLIKDALGRLDIQSGVLRRYVLPVGHTPNMIALQGDWIWFTENDLPRLGVLDPVTAVYESRDISTSYGQGAFGTTCVKAPPAGPYTLPVSQEINLDLNQTQYPAIQESAGWYIYQMPKGAQSYGISLVDGKAWVVDNGRQKLVQTWLQATLRACKKWDMDHDAGTTGDQYPIHGWRMDLFKDGSPDPVDSKLTGADGCAQWDGLELPATYEVREETRSDWELIASTGCAPTAITLPGTYACTFVNWTEVSRVFLPMVRR